MDKITEVFEQLNAIYDQHKDVIENRYETLQKNGTYDEYGRLVRSLEEHIDFTSVNKEEIEEVLYCKDDVSLIGIVMDQSKESVTRLSALLKYNLVYTRMVMNHTLDSPIIKKWSTAVSDIIREYANTPPYFK